METPRNPNQLNPETLSKVVTAAHSILEQMGVQSSTALTAIHGGEPDMLSATVGLDRTALTDVPEGALPTVGINQPLGDFADRARWAYEITYGMHGMQHGGASRHVLILKGEQPAAEMAFYDGSPDRPLTEIEAQQVATDLSRIAEIGQ